MKDRRRDLRTDAALRVSVTHPSFGTIVTTTRDLSDGGTFVAVDERLKLPLGSIVLVQIMDSPQAPPALRMRVMRLEKEGMGLAFVKDEEVPSGGAPAAP